MVSHLLTIHSPVANRLVELHELEPTTIHFAKEEQDSIRHFYPSNKVLTTKLSRFRSRSGTIHLTIGDPAQFGGL